MANVPKMTYYVRVLDNITGEQITTWEPFYKSALWYYGKCNGLEGGESQFIVEFDIWNNEPSFNAGMYDEHCQDALNCRVTVEPNDTTNSNALFITEEPFMKARSTTFDHKAPFIPIRNCMMLTDITGNVNANRKGVIQGLGDHAYIQTKIVLPPNSPLITGQRYGFNFTFYYEFE